MMSEDNNFPFDLSLMELAVLELTNEGIIDIPRYHPSKSEELILLTTKTSYLWGTTVGLILEKNPDVQETKFIDAYRYALNKNTENIKEYYSHYMAHMGYHPPFEGGHFYNLHDDFVKFLGFNQEDILQAQNSAEKAYQSLINKGLIEDPIFTTIFGVPLAVIGFIPYGFTQKTNRGRTVYRRINALFWSYEMQNENGIKSTNINFRLLKILRAFKKALAEEMEDVSEKPEYVKS